MIWTKKQRQPQQQDPSPKSTSASSSIFSWLSKFRKKQSTATSSEPPKPCHVTDFIPRRLSVGNDEPHAPLTCRAPHFHHRSVDLDSRSDRNLLLAQSDRGILKELNSDPDPTRLKRIEVRPIRNGRRSFGAKVGPKVRVCSPRAKKREERKGPASSSPLERFAVVKSSSDPIRDFRESMVEMISEKGIQRPEELEGLLACYLSLNSDEHHDVIVKVFRQVWFGLNRELHRFKTPV